MLGTQIKTARKSKGMTQAELAKKIGISRAHLVAIEHDRYKTTFEIVQRISAITGKSLNFFSQ